MPNLDKLTSRIRVLEAGEERASVELSGYVACGSLRNLTRALEEAEAQNPEILVLKCEDLIHMDSSIIGELVAKHGEFERSGRQVRLQDVPERAMRILHFTNLDTFFHIERSQPERGHPETEQEESPRARPGELKPCRDLYGCREESCVNYEKPVYACWLTPHVPCKPAISDDLDVEVKSCVTCEVFKNNIDRYGEIQQDFENYVKEAEATHLRLEERIALQERGTEADRFLENVFDQAVDAVLLIDSENSEIRYANPQAKRVLALERDLPKGTALSEFCPELRIEPSPWRAIVFEGNEHVRRWDQAWTNANGRERVVEATYSLIREDGARSVLVVARDITDTAGRTSPEDRDSLPLSLVTDRVEAMLDLLAEPAYLVTPEGKVGRLNEKAAVLLEWSADEIADLDVDRLRGDARVSKPWENFAAALSEQTRWEGFLKVLTKSGKSVEAIHRATPFLPGNRANGFSIVTLDPL